MDNILGSEYDFVIFSTVRSTPRHIIRNKAAIQPDRTWLRDHLGFITDRHQICVGITRARHGLIIVGECVYVANMKNNKSIAQVMLFSSATMRPGETY